MFAKLFVFATTFETASKSSTSVVFVSIIPLIILTLAVLFFILFNIKIEFLSALVYLEVLGFFIMFLLLFLVNLPIEKMICKKFISQAKQKLEANNRLIKIGITGSYGKTSVKEILGSILSKNYKVLVTPKSFNTPMGICKTINNQLDNSTEIFICEMGAKKSGEIQKESHS